MFEKFLNKYGPVDSPIAPWVPHVGGDIPDFADVMRTWGGGSFGSGVYRVHSEVSSRAATRTIRATFPGEYANVIAFAFDWLGRNFVLDPDAYSDEQPMIKLIGLAEVQRYQIPVSLREFHEVELVDYASDALAVDWFEEWRASHDDRRLGFAECVGYRTPPFLGGTDDDDNLEVVDVEVYWSLTGQLYKQVKDLPEGTPVSGISLEQQ
ncbi:MULTISPECIES: T6SS immunity protein Tdi1 domain-containing protein [unclassified Saccharothrix]|uniref:T6SS immunity protein Tdi1 domain-containing protein n=1 Tax=unclassified Saccharothrix TaxID=2593673 RepID=UPI00307F62E7